MKHLIDSYDAARAGYSAIELAAALLLKNTMRCENPGRSTDLAFFSGCWVDLAGLFSEVNQAMDDLKRRTLAPLLGFYIGDLVTVSKKAEDGSDEVFTALVSHVCMPHTSDVEQNSAQPFELQLWLEPAQMLFGAWLSPERAGSTAIVGSLKELTRMVKPIAGAFAGRDAMNLNARKWIAHRTRDGIERDRLTLLERVGDHSLCAERQDIIVSAALEQAPHLVYSQWRFQEGDVLLVKFKDESCFRHIVFLYIDMHVSKPGVLHYFDGEMFAMSDEMDPCECKKPMGQIGQMSLFMPRGVHEIESDGAMGHILLAALAQRENLRARCGRWTPGYQEPKHVTAHRARLAARKQNDHDHDHDHDHNGFASDDND